jgi:hypothetical protein
MIRVSASGWVPAGGQIAAEPGMGFVQLDHGQDLVEVDPGTP